MSKIIWLREEVKENERRTPLTPENAKKLLENGYKVIVEKSKDRIFPDSEYLDIGCELVEAHSWINNAPDDAYILGLKELKEDSFPLKHKHIYFAHIFKGQDGNEEVFARYQKGGGSLFDLEFLVNEQGRRVAAFGFWAGYVGAATAIERYCHRQLSLDGPELTWHESKEEWVEEISNKLKKVKSPSSIIIGALGRCGSGARTLLEDLKLTATLWDYEETKKGGPFKEITDHDIFINTVLMTTKIPPFLEQETIAKHNKLKVIADVSCDPNSELNPIPIYNEHTTWEKPTIRINEQVEVIAVDNLPSALPKESSIDFSDQLISHLLNLCNEGEKNIVWKNASDTFSEKLKSALES